MSAPTTEHLAERRARLARICWGRMFPVTFGDVVPQEWETLKLFAGEIAQEVAAEHRAVIQAEIDRLEALRARDAPGSEMHLSMGLVLAGLRRALILLGGESALEAGDGG